MRQVVYCALIFFILQDSLSAQVEKFRYQPDRARVGILHHYVKSNIDGSDPEQIAVYVAARDRLEVFKYHNENPGSRAALVTAWMDWNLFSVRKLESWAHTAPDQRTLAAELEYLPYEKSVQVKVQTFMEKTPIPFFPFHVYNFDLTSLNFTFPHLTDPEGSFKVGIADPNFAENGPLFLYRGEVEIAFVSEDKRNDVVCRKYRINGPGVANRGGFVWVNRSEGYIEDMEMDLPDNPNWTSFKLTLKKREKLTPEQWKKFTDSHFGK